MGGEVVHRTLEMNLEFFSPTFGDFCLFVLLAIDIKCCWVFVLLVYTGFLGCCQGTLEMFLELKWAEKEQPKLV